VRIVAGMSRIRPVVFLLLAVAGFAARPLVAQVFDPASQDDSLALLRHFAAVEEPAGPPLDPGEFLPLEGETISLMGGAEIYRMEEGGHLEALLQAAFPGRRLRVRQVSWPADTVYLQQRPMFFHTETGDSREGSLPDTRDRLAPGLFVLCFGRMESLDGPEALPAFEEAYERLIAALETRSRRMLLVGPMPFAEAGPAASLAASRNETLAGYAARVAAIAERRGLPYVPSPEMEARHFLRNGIYLSPEGQAAYASALAGSLGFGSVAGGSDAEAAFEGRETLLAAIRRKNRLWHQYHRPTNWAFLFGDRQHVPSSRDHLDSGRRWFVEELERIPPLLDVADQAVWQAAAGSSSGPPAAPEKGGER